MSVSDVFSGLLAGAWIVGSMLALASLAVQAWLVAAATLLFLGAMEAALRGGRLVRHVTLTRRTGADTWADPAWSD